VNPGTPSLGFGDLSPTSNIRPSAIAKGREDKGRLATQDLSGFPAKISSSSHQIEEFYFSDTRHLAVGNADRREAVGLSQECRGEPEQRSGKECSIEMRRSGYLQRHFPAAYQKNTPVPAAGTEKAGSAGEMTGFARSLECPSEIERHQKGFRRPHTVSHRHMF